MNSRWHIWLIACCCRLCLSFIDPLESLKGYPLKSFLHKSIRCREQRPTNIIPAKSLHLVMLANSEDVSKIGVRRLQKEVFDFYAELHGYQNHTIDPKLVMDKYGTLHKPGAGHPIICSKPLVMLYVFRHILTEFDCEAKWIIFIDADFFIADYNRTLQSIIARANSNIPFGTIGANCEMIAQDAPTTINSGMLLFRMSRSSEIILQNWVDKEWHHHFKDVFWQEDQGWLQFIFLQYVQHVSNTRSIFDCAEFLLNKQPGVPDGMAESVVRNLCYAKMLGYHGLLPGNRSFGELCLLSGLHPLDRINVKDWAGQYKMDSANTTLVFQLDDTAFVGRAQLGPCKLSGIFAYHGKDRLLLAQLQQHWLHFKAAAKNMTISSPHPLGATPAGSGRPSNTQLSAVKVAESSCDKEILYAFRTTMQDMSWVPTAWKKRLESEKGSRSRKQRASLKRISSSSSSLRGHQRLLIDA